MTGARADFTDAAALYVGKVMHARMKPVGHRFSYRVMSLLIDLDRLGDADKQSRLFGVNRAALYSFHEKDHGDCDGSTLRGFAQRCAAEHGIDLSGGRVRLLCYPRLLGYTFNPLSVYFCEDAAGRLALLIYEVRNTFGELHTYALPVRNGDLTTAGVRQTAAKSFYVSPFIDMPMRYHFRIGPPGRSVKLRILETDADGPLLAATFFGERHALTDGALLRAFAALPLMTFKIIAAIHWEALRLWLKGLKLVPRPGSPEPKTRFAAADPDAYMSNSPRRNGSMVDGGLSDAGAGRFVAKGAPCPTLSIVERSTPSCGNQRPRTPVSSI